MIIKSRYCINKSTRYTLLMDDNQRFAIVAADCEGVGFIVHPKTAFLRHEIFEIWESLTGEHIDESELPYPAGMTEHHLAGMTEQQKEMIRKAFEIHGPITPTSAAKGDWNNSFTTQGGCVVLWYNDKTGNTKIFKERKPNP